MTGPQLNSIFSANFMVLSADTSVEQLQSLVSSLNPKYIIISRKVNTNQQEDLYHYAYFTGALFAFLGTMKGRYLPSDSIEQVLQLHEYLADKAVEASSQTLSVDPEYGLAVTASVSPGELTILTDHGRPSGLVDKQLGQEEAVYKVKVPPGSIPFEYRTTGLQGSIFLVGTNAKRGTLKGGGKIERYPYCTFPESVGIGQIEALQVLIKAKRDTMIQGRMTLNIKTGEEAAVILVAVKTDPADAFEILNSSMATLQVPVEGKDSNSISFKLKAKKLGLCAIKISFHQGQGRLTNIELKTRIVDEQVSKSDLAEAGYDSRLIPTSETSEPTLELLVTQVRGNPGEYDFSLRSDSLKYAWKRVGFVAFEKEPEAAFREILGEIERDSKQAQDHPSFSHDLEEALEGKGRKLYDDLFPIELKTLYWGVRDKIRTVTVISEEPWIPWEIIKPWHKTPTGEIEEDDFLCLKYAFSRWLEGVDTPDPREPMKTVRTVIPTDTKLPGAKEEASFISKFSEQAGYEVDEGPTFDEVISSLKIGGFDLLHFSSHAGYDKYNPTASELVLQGNHALRPENIGGLCANFGKSHPLIIMNACQTAQEGFFLTAIGSWARSFLDAEAVAFLGTLWSISDSMAVKFTRNFYQKLSEGIPIDEALRQTRRLLASTKGDLSWLAYSLYAQPNTVIKLGSHRT